MTRDRVLLHTAQKCRRLALRVRTNYARLELLRLADDFDAQAEQARVEQANVVQARVEQAGVAQARAEPEPETKPQRRLEAAD